MKPITILLVILSLASLACLQTAAMTNPSTAPAPASTPVEYAYGTEPESGAVFEAPTESRTCAIVTAIFSLTLREKPDEKSNAIYWLPAQTNVLVTGTVGAWWQVSADGYTGYARAQYLKESECK